MSKKNQSAFPHLQYTAQGHIVADSSGMTLRQYAAIKLRVPDSGEEWIDAMIKQSLRDEFAAKAMAAFMASPMATEEWIEKHAAESAYGAADAMLSARGK